MPVSEALLSAKFLGKAGCFLKQLGAENSRQKHTRPFRPCAPHSRPSQRQLFTGWQSDKELGELPRRVARRQGEQ